MSNRRQNPNSVLSDRRIVFNQNGENKKIRPSAFSIIIGALIFCSIAPFASADVWSEAVVLSVIFIIGAVAVLRHSSSANSEIKFLTAPFFALAGYSFVQGLVTVFIQNKSLQFSAALPFSFELTASFWCALKFLAPAVFIQFILSGARRQVRFLIWTLIFTGNFYAVLGIVRFALQARYPAAFGWFILPELRPGIGFGTFINQNHFAFLMLMNLGLNIGLCAFGGLAKNIRRLLVFCCLITWAAIILTASRGGIISSVVVIVVLILLSFSKFNRAGLAATDEKPRSKFGSLARKTTVFAVLIFALIVAVALIGQDRVVSRFEEISSELESVTDAHGFRRIDVWRATALMIDERPFYGVGFGGFRYAVSQSADISGAVVPQQAHNDYLELAASGGAVGVMLGIWFLYGFFRTLKKRFAAASSRLTNAARMGALGALAGIAVHSCFDFGLQLIGNWLFTAAVLSIALYRENIGEKEVSGASLKGFIGKNLIVWKSLQAIFLLCLSFVSVWFGFSRLENFRARNASDRSFAENASAKVFFDADFYESKAFVNGDSGDGEAAANDLQQAIYYRPFDYTLHLNLAKIRQSQSANDAAENSFREAIRLAPYYAAPHFYYGYFLVAANRRAEGFGELHQAFQRNPKYFAEITRLAWRETNADPNETVRLLSPLAAAEKEKLADFLLDKKHYAAVAALACRAEDLTDEQRDDLIQKLFEKRQIFYASQIFRRECDLSNRGADNLVNGNFETDDLRENLGFGWRVGDLPETIKIGFDFDEKFSANGENSLAFVFDGSAEPSLTLLSQTVVVEKKRLYKFSFAYRTEKIVTGGEPVLRLIYKQTENDITRKEIKLTPNSGGWVNFSTTIQTGEQTEALEIKLTRQSCSQSLCPILGRLWLDNFVLD